MVCDQVRETSQSLTIQVHLDDDLAWSVKLQKLSLFVLQRRLFHVPASRLHCTPLLRGLLTVATIVVDSDCFKSAIRCCTHGSHGRVGAPTRSATPTDVGPTKALRTSFSVLEAPYPTATGLVMAKKVKKIVRHEYTKADVKELRAHSKARTPITKIAKQMKRTEGSLRQKALRLGIRLGHRR